VPVPELSEQLRILSEELCRVAERKKEHQATTDLGRLAKIETLVVNLVDSLADLSAGFTVFSEELEKEQRVRCALESLLDKTRKERDSARSALEELKGEHAELGLKLIKEQALKDSVGQKLIGVALRPWWRCWPWSNLLD